MRKILPILLAAIVYLTPLYPIYAQNTATSPATPKRGDAIKKVVVITDDNTASRSGLFLSKLAKFKDKEKAKRLENINTNLNALNQRRTLNMRNSLDKIAQILENLKIKTQKAADSGREVSSINDTIADVQAKWEKADLAVTTQSEKDYTISIDSETTVWNDANNARQSLGTDLKSVHMQVVDTRKALADAIRTTLSLIKGGQNGSE